MAQNMKANLCRDGFMVMGCLLPEMVPNLKVLIPNFYLMFFSSLYPYLNLGLYVYLLSRLVESSEPYSA